MGSRRKFTRRFTEEIGKLAGNVKRDCREEDQRTCHKIAGVYGIVAQPDCFLQPQKVEDKRIVQDMIETRIIKITVDPPGVHLRWKFKDDDSAQILLTDTHAYEEMKT
ncbi:hypothetical protein BHM03_00030500 [Ensete ventricosum]|nr:hypothetical protein BHM03_00030500 [Ensete ventricosum]